MALKAIFSCYEILRLHIIFSVNPKFYIGQTIDINQRLKRHNAGSENLIPL
ncbi:MAG: GIY-YIG nuclease family protein [Bacteroidetes bacterium]|nr:GIY-YIG nuclease family protein [Bacteroidota bacterium]